MHTFTGDHMNNTAYELHDSSAPPTKEERLLEAVLDDIQNDGEYTLEAIGSEALLAPAGYLRADVRLRLFAAITSKGLTSQPSDDEKLGRCIRELVFGYIAKGVEE